MDLGLRDQVVLVTGSGAGIGRAIDPADCEREIAVSLFGTMHCTRAALPGMIERGHGRIVNIISDAARVGQEKEVAYSAAKGGVISFTKSLAREVGRHGVTVNAVSPAATDTQLRRAMLARMAEKIGAVETAAEFLRARAGDARPADLLPFLDSAANEAVAAGDKL